jgi:hypothetical protein
MEEPETGVQQADPESTVTHVKRSAGNRAIQHAAGNVRGAKGAASPVLDAVDISGLLAAKVPDLLPEIDPDQIDALQARANVRARNADLKQQLANLGPSETIFESYEKVRYERRYEQIASKLQPKPEGADEIRVPTLAVLAPDVSEVNPEASDAEGELKASIVQELLRSPFVTVEVYDRPGSALEGSRIVHDVALSWRGKALEHTRGKVTFADLTQKPGALFAREYSDRVVSELRDLRNVLIDLEGAIDEVKPQHTALLKGQDEDRFAWAWSEIVGGQAWRHDPQLDIWDPAEVTIKTARTLLAQGKVKLAGLAYLRAQYAANEALSEYQDYAGRVMGGASTVVKWLGRAKLAGKFASSFVGGPLGRVGQALVVGGYSFGQEAIEQKLEKGSVDVKGLTKEATVDALMAYVGGRTEAAFAERLTVHLERRLLLANFSPALTKRIISAAAASTSSFYAVPADIVLRSIVTGKSRMPTSVDELADMLTEQATAGVMIGSFLGVTQHGVDPEVRPQRSTIDVLEGQPSRRGPTAAGIGGGEPPGPRADRSGMASDVHEAWVRKLAKGGLAPRPASGPVAGPVGQGDYTTLSGEHVFAGPDQAFAAYHEALSRAGRNEVGIFRSVSSAKPEYRVCVGNESGVSSPGDEWVSVLHSHPNPGNVLTLRMPAPHDVWDTWRTSLRLQRPVTEFIDYPLPGGQRGLVAFTTEPGGKVTIDWHSGSGPEPPAPFESPDAYGKYWGERATYVEKDTAEYAWRLRDIADYYADRGIGAGHRDAVHTYLARRELKPFFDSAGLDVLSPSLDVPVDWGDMKIWREFFKTNPNASRKQIEDQIARMRRR